MQTHIDTAEVACRRNEEIATTHIISIYTDGSKMDGVVGAAAVTPGPQHIKRMCLGSQATVTEYAAEVQGISLHLTMAQSMTYHSPAHATTD